MSTHASHSMQRLAGELRFDIAIQATRTSCAVCSDVNPSSTSMVSLLEAFHQIDVLHFLAPDRRCSRCDSSTR